MKTELPIMPVEAFHSVALNCSDNLHQSLKFVVASNMKKPLVGWQEAMIVGGIELKLVVTVSGGTSSFTEGSASGASNRKRGAATVFGAVR